MFKSVLFCLALTLTITPAFLSPQKSEALSGSQFKAGRIMDDAIFFNPMGMSPEQIQSFLNAKVPVCDTNGDKPYAGTTRKAYAASHGVSTPFICLKGYSQNTPERLAESGLCGYLPARSNRTAAQIIYDVSHACNVNPKVLLVLLQKEQSLVTDDWPWPIQYTKATGFACPDTAPCDPAYAGFFYQVHNAARQFKRYSVDSHLFNYRANRNNNILWHPNTGCGSSTVFIQNQATAGLYNYTPYRPNQAALNNLYGTGDGCSSYGNRNFWRMYNDWFGSTHASYIINVSGTPTLYLQYADKRYAIPSQDVLNAYGFQNAPITPVSSSYLSSLDNGGVLTTVFKFEGSTTVRLADNGKHFGIPSSTICDGWGLECFDPEKVKELPTFLSALIPGGGTVKSLMWTPGGGYSKMQNGKRAPIIGSMSTLGYTATSATPISTPINSRQPYDTPVVANSTLVKFGSSPLIYYYNAGGFYTFPSYVSFLGWTSGISNKVHLDTKSLYSTSPPSSDGLLGNFIHNGASKYFISEGKKFDITTVAADWPATTDHVFASPLLNQLGTKSITSASLFRDSSSGVVFEVRDKKRNYFVSMRDFYASGADKRPLSNINSEITSSLSKGSILLGEGALFKKSPTSSSILVVEKGNSSSFILTEIGQIQRLGLSGLKVISANSSTTATYPAADAFIDIVKTESSYFLLARDNKRLGFNSANIARWGANPASAADFSGVVTKNIPVSPVEPRFAVHPGGTIYYGYGGEKRPIGSYSRYLSLGGNATNTFAASSVFLSSLPTGPVMR